MRPGPTYPFPGAASGFDRGLRRALMAVITVVALLSGATLFVMQSLNHQVDRWSRVEQLNGQREKLLANVLRYSEDRTPANYDEVIAEFDEIGANLADLRRTHPEDRFPTEADILIARARDLFSELDDLQTDTDREHQAMTGIMLQLQAIAAKWTRVIDNRKQAISEESGGLETLQSQINAELDLLTDAMLAAAEIRRQLDAARRLSANSLELAQRLAAAIDASSLPPPCSDARRVGPATICKPSTERVLTDLQALKTAETADIASLLITAIWSVEAYSRSGAIRYGELSQDLAASIDATRALSIEIQEVNRAETALNRLSRFLLQTQNNLDVAVGKGESAAQSARAMPSLIANLSFRTNGLVRNSDWVDSDPQTAVAVLEKLESRWRDLEGHLGARDSALTNFESRMTELAGLISTRADDVRASTSLWVQLFATGAFVVTLSFFVAALIFLSLARSRFVEPLTRVTGAILDLSRGHLDKPAHLKQRSFGFEQLATALEDLRLAMKERDALNADNARQKSQIEENLRKLERTTQEMEWLAMHDPLTGLGNRRRADADLEELTRLNQQSDEDFCLIHVDLDRFKEINDTLGHKTGDHLLEHVARKLKVMRDIPNRCYRIGGDEFLIAIHGRHTKKAIESFAQKIIDELSTPIEFDGRTIRNNASLGISFGRDSGGNAAATLVNADLALYEAKNAGRNDFRFFRSELQQQSKRRKSDSDRLMAALEAEAFVPVYQPQLYAQGLVLRGLETLCRWHDPDRGWIPPSQFLPLAEDLKVLGQIDQIMFRKAADDIARLQSMGHTIPKISFNLTADRLLYAGLADDLTGAFPEGVRIAVELLESMSLDSLTDSVRWSIDGLKDKGIEIEIDDFGSCRASIAGLIAVGPDAMKIDRTIIAPMVTSSQHLSLVQAIVEIGRALSIEVVAEGVETQDHIELLTSMGCDVLQGFALARPMPVDDLMAFLDSVTGVDRLGEPGAMSRSA